MIYLVDKGRLFFSKVENGLRSELIKSRYCQNFGPHSDYDQEVSDQAGKLDWIKNSEQRPLSGLKIADV